MSSIQRRGPGAQATPVPGLSPEEWDVLRNSVCKGFSDTEAKVFGFRCQALGLSPLTGQITAFKQGGGVVPIVTIDGYRAIAAKIDPGYVVEIEYLTADGWVDWIPEAEPASQARAKVWRTGAERPVTKAVSRKEFAGNSGPWRSMPHHMLAKVAESHALRMAFPQGLSGTYSADEMANPVQAAEAPAAALPKPASTAATASKQQLEQLATAMNRVLGDIGREAFLANITAAFGVQTLQQLPAEHIDNVLRSLGNKDRVAAWNEGLDGHGNQVVSDERIAELQALSQAAAVEAEYIEEAEAAA
jgi:phage recombination protein Bet